MNRIKALFQSMSGMEVMYLKQLLESFHLRGRNKALEFISLLEMNPEIEAGDIAQQLAYSTKEKAYIMMKNRLLEKMFETLSLDVNLLKNPELQEDLPMLKAIQIKKKLVYSLSLHKKGLNDLIEDLLNECMVEAENYGFPELKLEALSYLRSLSTDRKKIIEVYTPAISWALEQFHTDMMGKLLMEDIRAFLLDQDQKAAIARLEADLSPLAQRLHSAYSIRGHFYLLWLKIKYLEMSEGCRDQMRALAYEMIDLIESTPGLRSRNRWGEPFKLLATIDLQTYRFEEAELSALKAMEHFPPQRLNYFLAAIHLVYAYIYQGKWKEGLIITQELKKIKSKIGKVWYVYWVDYLESCLAFLQNDYPKAYKLLNSAMNLSTEKEAWNPTLRIYEIQVLTELKKYDLVESKVESLRKYLGRINASERIMFIYRQINKMVKHSFLNWSLDADDGKVEYSEIGWEPMGREIIKFDIWLRSKNSRSPFPHLFQEEMRKLAR